MQKSKVSIRSAKPVAVAPVVQVTLTPQQHNTDSSWKRKLFNEKTYMLIGIIVSILALSFSIWSIHKNGVAMKRIESMNSSLADLIIDAKKPSIPTQVPVAVEQPESTLDKLRKRLESKKESIKYVKKIDPAEYGISNPETLKSKPEQSSESKELKTLIDSSKLEANELKFIAKNPKYMKDIQMIKECANIDFKSLMDQSHEKDEVGIAIDAKFSNMTNIVKNKLLEFPNADRIKIQEIFDEKPEPSPPQPFIPVIPPTNNIHRDIPTNEQDILFSLSQINKNKEEIDVDKEELERDLKLLLGSSKSSTHT